MSVSALSSSAPETAPSSSSAWPIHFYADEFYAPERGLEPAFALLERAGIDRVDLRTVGHANIMEASDASLDALEQALRRYGLKVGAVETPIGECPLRHDNGISWGDASGFRSNLSFDEHLRLMPRAFAIADRFKAEQIRCFSFWREYAFDDAFNEMVERLGILARHAESAGHQLSLKNDPCTMAGTGAELSRIVKAVGSPALHAGFDVCNAARLGAVPFPGEYGLLRDVLVDVTVRFQVIDIRSGWNLSDPDSSGPKGRYFPSYFWKQSADPICGWVDVSGRRLELNGPRTFLPLEDTVGVDFPAFFRELKNDGYRRNISVDPGYFLAGAGSTTDADIERNFNQTLSSLRRLLAGLN